MRVPELELELEFEFNAIAELELELVNSSVALDGTGVGHPAPSEKNMYCMERTRALAGAFQGSPT